MSLSVSAEQHRAFIEADQRHNTPRTTGATSSCNVRLRRWLPSTSSGQYGVLFYWFRTEKKPP